MTVHELEQYRALCVEIRLLSDQIRKLKYSCSVVKGSYSDFPYIQRRFMVLGAEEAANDETKLMSLVDRCRAAKNKAEEFINSIPDSEIRTIFSLRYLYGARKPSWQEVAFKIGKFDESYPRRKHDKYLRERERITPLPNML